MIHRHGLSILLITLCAGIALSWRVHVAWNAEFCAGLGWVAAHQAQNRDWGITFHPPSTYHEEISRYGIPHIQRYVDTMIMELYRTAWDKETARREGEARCLAKASW